MAIERPPASDLRAALRHKAAARLAEIRERRARYDTDLEAFAADCLTIRPKTGGDMLLRFNEVQRLLHQRLEAQKAATGKVRALVLKARQPGISTYVEARYYHRTSRSRGLRAFILTHKDDATDNVFQMAQRFHENNPHAPHTGTSNAKDLSFDALDSGFAVGTAGAKGVGRSHTIQLFHGSEVAFWPNAQEHATGALQAVPDAPGTEVILESTANGIGGLFYNMCQAAMRGTGDFEIVFIPWFRHEEYAKQPPPGWRAPTALADYAEPHGLTLPQLYWAYVKNAELAATEGMSPDEICWKFQQEYPATAAEAFQVSGHDGYIRPALVMKARKTTLEPRGSLVLGVDPARFGNDRFSVARRRGRKVLKVESRRKLDTVAGAGWIMQIIDAEKPARVFIDVGGQGAGVGDLLVDWYGSELIRLINFGGAPLEPPPADDDKGGGPRNRRAEMWMKSRAWLEDPGGADIPDSDTLQADACAPGYKWDSNQRLVLESKDDITKRGLPSPDEWDAVALTFAEPVPVHKKPFTGAGSAAGGDSVVGY